MDRAARAAGITSPIVRTSRGDGAVLGFDAAVPKELITTRFVDRLLEGLREHNSSEPESAMRLRLSMHGGDVLAGPDRWAGDAIVLACDLVDSQLLRNVLAAAREASVAVLISEDWYDAVIAAGHAPDDGYRRVTVSEPKCRTTAWVRVPERSQPPGLEATDFAADKQPTRLRKPHDTEHAASARSILVHGTAFIGSHIHGDVVLGNKYTSQ
ncbi:hypothetical protein ACIA58_23455 [Kribbella sp. NPDC051586]|uniref:hypothetical protein n=1 Tax=Kribbella sp. NPDC051586 TaxID=3364118 RepID=UPI0037A0560F